MFKLRFILTLTALIVFMVACTSNQESQSRSTEQIKVEQSSYKPDEIMTRSDIADHLADLAVKTTDVQDAAAIVLGPYTVVGINIAGDAERNRTSSIKHSVLEALEHDPYGREAVVIADADMPERLRGMRESIQNGAPVKGVADELANIVSRYMPTVPKEHDTEEDIMNDEKREP